MPSMLPEGGPAPPDGTLPRQALDSLPSATFSFYVHVPFCRVRCGYCDFNTYTAAELGTGPGASRARYAETVVAEIRLARRVLGDEHAEVATVFFGGGTPTLLPPADLASIVAAIDHEFGLAPDVEITTEANPDSVSPRDLDELRAGGINRISFGMQSAVPSVLAILDRTHDPMIVPEVVAWARASGFDQISLDLIYGTPGESLDDWRRSLDAVVALKPDHVSAYALIVEDGTALARQVRQEIVAPPDDDDLADKYELADQLLGDAGFDWYEVSNWSRDDASRCQHNLAYWSGANWWGAGPGAHSHVGSVRWWNVKSPLAYAERLASGKSPAQAREVLDEGTRTLERVLLESRLATGLPVDVLTEAGLAAVPGQIAAERVLLQSPGDSQRDLPHRLVLTRKGRLLADAVVRSLLSV
ncbi:MAG: radical SAM family heme chaperone HemW [Nocardioidaceae bacterium]